MMVPFSLAAAAAHAVDPSLVCRNCRQPGHFARDCSNAVVCNVCGGRGHMAADCPSDPRAVRGARSRR